MFVLVDVSEPCLRSLSDRPRSSFALRRHTALATSIRSEASIAGKRPRLRRHRTPSFATRLHSKLLVAREAALFARDVPASLPSNLTLLVGMNAGEAAPAFVYCIIHRANSSAGVAFECERRA
jgi:hypothetical protein